MPELSLSKQALIELLERASTDPCEPYGCDPWEPPPGQKPPLGPGDIDGLLRLNPQPLPPKGHWRAANAARTIIVQVLNLHEVSEALASDGGERAQVVINRKVSEFVDDWCGTPPRYPKPFPWPWGPLVRGTEELQPIELIVAGAQFQKAADALEGNAALQESFEGAADRFLQTGVSLLEETY